MNTPLETLQRGPDVSGVISAAPKDNGTAKEIREHLRAEYVTPHDNTLFAIGVLAADDAINLRDLSRLRRYAEDANSEDERTVRIGMNALLGIATRFADLIAAGNAKGLFVVFGQLVTRSDILYSFTRGRGAFVPVFHSVFQTMTKLLSAAPSLRVGDAAAKSERADDQPAPTKIEIVAMPERITSSAVERDAGGNIVKTTQVEMDTEPE